MRPNIWNEMNTILERCGLARENVSRIEVISNYRTGEGRVLVNYYEIGDNGQIILNPDTEKPEERTVYIIPDIWKPGSGNHIDGWRTWEK